MLLKKTRHIAADMSAEEIFDKNVYALSSIQDILAKFYSEKCVLNLNIHYSISFCHFNDVLFEKYKITFRLIKN